MAESKSLATPTPIEQTSLLLTTTPEVRNRVFELLFEGGVISLDPGGRMELHNEPVLPGEVQIRQATATNSRIVRVCRQMYREALPVFYKMVELQLWDIGSPGWIQLPKDSRIGCFRIVTLMYPAVSYLRFYHLTNLKKTRHLKFKTTWHFWEPQELSMDMCLPSLRRILLDTMPAQKA